MPSPNEIPAGLGDVFLYGAAEGFNALSPFDVQSPLHHAMAQRRELDQQANLALTNYMITSRDRVEAIPAVAPPAPMVVTGHFAAAPGGGVEQPAGVVPTTAGGFGGAARPRAPRRRPQQQGARRSVAGPGSAAVAGPGTGEFRADGRGQRCALYAATQRRLAHREPETVSVAQPSVPAPAGAPTLAGPPQAAERRSASDQDQGRAGTAFPAVA